VRGADDLRFAGDREADSRRSREATVAHRLASDRRKLAAGTRHEGLGSQILSELGTHSRPQKPVDSAEVPIEDERKGSTVNERVLDRLAIGHRWSFSRSFTDD
jgi:hypothetical protein